MNLSPICRERLDKAFALYDELAEFLEGQTFGSKLAGLPSNTIGQQLWCVIGARESYTKGIQKGQWDGFHCSLSWEQTADKGVVSTSLRQSAETARTVLSGIKEWSEAQERLAIEFLEHEIQHHGQLIRYLYGLKVGVPAGWKARYHLD